MGSEFYWTPLFHLTGGEHGDTSLNGNNTVRGFLGKF